MLDFISFQGFSLLFVVFAASFFAFQACAVIWVMNRLWPNRGRYVREWEYFIPLILIVAFFALT